MLAEKERGGETGSKGGRERECVCKTGFIYITVCVEDMDAGAGGHERIGERWDILEGKTKEKQR